MPIILSETWAKPGEPLNLRCLHEPHTPRFDPKAARYLSLDEVQARWPRYDAVCTLCGQYCRIWASLAHRQALGGD